LITSIDDRSINGFVSIIFFKRISDGSKNDAAVTDPAEETLNTVAPNEPSTVGPLTPNTELVVLLSL
jgi:hypothetical protein